MFAIMISMYIVQIIVCDGGGGQSIEECEIGGH